MFNSSPCTWALPNYCEMNCHGPYLWFYKKNFKNYENGFGREKLWMYIAPVRVEGSGSAEDDPPPLQILSGQSEQVATRQTDISYT